MAKYYSKKVTRDGMTFDSVKEYKRWCELRLLEKSGEISNLQRQVEFELIPAQREPDRVGVRGGKIKGKTIEHAVKYVADYTYNDSNGSLHVEDVKGYKEGGAYRVFAIKRKLMLYIHGLVVEEV